MKVRCINAKERGIPIVEGQEYTVKSEFLGKDLVTHEVTVPEMKNVKGYTLIGVEGHFRADRFEVLT